MSIGRATPAARSAHVPLGYAAVRASCHCSALRTGTGRQQSAIPLKCRERLADPPGLVTGSTTTSRQHGNSSVRPMSTPSPHAVPSPGPAQPSPLSPGAARSPAPGTAAPPAAGGQQLRTDECYDKGKARLWQDPIHQLINISLEVLQMNVMVKGSHSSGKSTFFMEKDRTDGRRKKHQAEAAHVSQMEGSTFGNICVKAGH
ncbi:hypothetical protein chiPu_0013572 [Chiloscyllium punctatum]|uniref:Uncharacterized protein n=1 Tax=Chiloscyllium punctatum TaxID=137246 RepID=A0A401SXF6_CHIPU|nr:hypothetical protein [Chiloscyllium punctatum]